jgi:hypothetical protein
MPLLFNFMATTPQTQVLPYIVKAPKAFAGFARRHNDLVAAVRPLLDLRAGLRIRIDQSATNTVISYRG